MSYAINWHYKEDTVEDEKKCIDSDGRVIPGVYESSGLNITFNLVRMFSWAFGVEYWCDVVNGKKGSELINPLAEAIMKMMINREEAITFNSPNGWGTYPHALKFLENLLSECQEHLDMYCEINR